MAAPVEGGAATDFHPTLLKEKHGLKDTAGLYPDQDKRSDPRGTRPLVYLKGFTVDVPL